MSAHSGPLRGDCVSGSTSGPGTIELEPFSHTQSGPVTMVRYRVLEQLRETPIED